MPKTRDADGKKLKAETKPTDATAPDAAGTSAASEADKAAARRPAFDIKAEKLPDDIDDRAFGSGHYPHDKKMKRKKYDKQLGRLQIELQKMAGWARETGERIVIVFEGRDGAGKGGAITRFTQHLNPRHARVVALSKPTETERGQWYFQRYASHMPTRGDIVFFDRSWYNRSGVERAMGFATAEQIEEFLREAPAFEGMLVRDGVRVFKLFLTIGREMQMKRLHARYHDPLKRWKLSPIDFEAIERFDAYSTAFEEQLARTSTERAPWTVIRSNDKLRTRLNVIRHVLHALPYTDKDEDAIGDIDRKIVLDASDFLDSGGES
jgi:polyphosphate kinase 2